VLFLPPAAGWWRWPLCWRSGVLLGGVALLDRMRGAAAADEHRRARLERDCRRDRARGRGHRHHRPRQSHGLRQQLLPRQFRRSAAPPALPFGRPQLEATTLLARNAWRDGTAALEEVEAPDETRWQISATRAGRGDDHLIWRLRPIARARGADLGALDLAGPFGKMLSRAGIETAITTADGVIRAVSAGFAERAAGDERATLVGQDFVSFLRSDERDRIFFAREGRGGTPQTLVDIPLVDPESASRAAGPDEATSLMLLIDSGVGIGSGWDGASQAGWRSSMRCWRNCRWVLP
jgi:two-component system, cell cycle sensor histidine kinase and response regulator CckA